MMPELSDNQKLLWSRIIKVNPMDEATTSRINPSTILKRITILSSIGIGITVTSSWLLQLLSGSIPKLPANFQHGNSTRNFNIAHFAALSGNKEALQWAKTNFPKLLKQKTTFGFSIAHFAALSGSKESLQWVKNNYPKQLTQKIQPGDCNRDIAYCAASSGNPEALRWVKENYPKLFVVKERDRHFMLFTAFRNSDARAIEEILSILGGDFSIKKYICDTEEAIKFNEVLDKNTVIHDVELYYKENVPHELIASIDEKLLRNKKIPGVMQGVVALTQGRFQLQSSISKLCFDALRHVVGFLIPNHGIANAWLKVDASLNPTTRFIRQLAMPNTQKRAQKCLNDRLSLDREMEDGRDEPENVTSVQKEESALIKAAKSTLSGKLRQLTINEQRPISALESYAHPPLLSRYGYTHLTRHHMGLVSFVVDKLKMEFRNPNAEECLKALKDEICRRNITVNPIGTLAALILRFQESANTHTKIVVPFP